MSRVDLAHMQRCLDAEGARDYMPGLVSWEDGDRGVLPNGKLSEFGSNNTDTKLKGKDGQVSPYLRTQNYDEKLGVTTADKIVAGVEGGREVTVQEVLETLSERARAHGFSHVDAAKPKPQHPVVVRNMYCFVPLERDQAAAHVVPTHYSFQTLCEEKPRNLLVCGSKEGVDVQCDALGEKPLYALKDGRTHYYKVEESDVAVGEAMDKTATTEVGIRGMGARSNAFVVVSIPNHKWDDYDGSRSLGGPPVYRSLGAPNLGRARAAVLGVDDESCGTFTHADPPMQWDGEATVVVTVLYYNTLRDLSGAKDQPIAVPPADVANAVRDMERAYALCEASGPLSELPAMLVKMEARHYDTLRAKAAVDPKFAFRKRAAAEALGEA